MSIPHLLYKNSDESKLYNVSFASQLITGESLSSATINSVPVGLTIGSPALSNGVVQFRASGGIDGVSYLLDISVNTSNSNIYSDCIRICVQDCEWLIEMSTMLRFLINDLESTPTYSDARLAQILCVAAKYVQQDVGIATYTINTAHGTITPDFTDVPLMNLTVMRAACFLDQSTLRTQAAMAGIKAELGPLRLDTSSNTRLTGFIKLLDDGACSAYKELLRQYMLGNLNILQAVLSPFIHNAFVPRIVGEYEDRFFHH